MTEQGIYCPSNFEDLDEAFEKYCPNKSFLDIGSGTGRVLGLAWKKGATVAGVEIEDDFYKHTDFKKWVRHTDYNNIDFHLYDILYYFMKGTDDEDRLIKKINKEARSKIIIYRRGSSNEEVEEFLAKLKGFEVIDTFIYMYILSKV
jgi:SAM-dependent methyltransferase